MIVYVKRDGRSVIGIFNRPQEDAAERIDDNDADVIAYRDPPKTADQIARSADETQVKDLSVKSTLSAAELQEAVKSLLKLKVREIE